jgi:hypothetical protein
VPKHLEYELLLVTLSAANATRQEGSDGLGKGMVNPGHFHE